MKTSNGQNGYIAGKSYPQCFRFFLDNKRIHAIVMIMLLASVLLSACGHIIYSCKVTPKRIEEANRTGQTPLTVDKLKHIIMDDTTHNKIVVFYSACCGPCIYEMKNVLSKFYDKDTARTRWYFVQEDCGGVPISVGAMKKVGIESEMYYILDDKPEFSPDNYERFNNMTNYIFALEQKVNGAYGIPFSYVVDKHGHLKTTRLFISDKVKADYKKWYGKDYENLLEPYNVTKLFCKKLYPDVEFLDQPIDVETIDFLKEDTIGVPSTAKQCTIDGVCK